MNLIIYNNFNQKLAEETQNILTKFFLVTKIENSSYNQITPFIKCRDFLNDVLYCITFNTKINIYGFNYDHTINNKQKEDFYVCLKFHSKKAVTDFQNNFQYLTKFEILYKLKTYTTYEKTNKVTVLLIKHNPFWFSNTLTLSLFTFILRCLSHPNITGNFWDFITNTKQTYKEWDNSIKTIPSKESNYIENIPTLRYFIFNLPKLSDDYKQQKYDFVYDIHNYSGFLCYVRELQKSNPNKITIKDITQCQEDVLDVIPY